jgi:hypothetical protein
MKGASQVFTVKNESRKKLDLGNINNGKENNSNKIDIHINWI